uniref:Uncharacterized protein n=1 Tax=viral metagenome TaxID=1070528 RepID=A0A6M3L5S8_9ZZZZ
MKALEELADEQLVNMLRDWSWKYGFYEAKHSYSEAEFAQGQALTHSEEVLRRLRKG